MHDENDTPPVLAVRGVAKRFPGVVALAGVDLELRAGEVHALMGQNGAGKSTLIKVLTGVHAPDAGEVLLRGRTFRPASPADARRRGVSTVYQEVNLAPSLSIAENLLLGDLPRWGWHIRWGATRRRAEELLGAFGLKLDVRRAVGECPVAVQQIVAIARAAHRDASVLILDEPTSSLDAKEAETLFVLMERLKGRGMAILFVTHFLEQVYRVSDRITVLRNGAKVGTWRAAELGRRELVGQMLGAPLEGAGAGIATGAGAAEAAAGEVVLRVRGLGKRRVLAPFDAEVRAGEVLGFAGLLGSGRTEAARLIFGAERPDGGSVSVGGRRVRAGSVRAAVAAGIGLCPEDRKAEGIVPEMSVRENIALVAQRRAGRLGFVSRRAQQKLAEEFIRRLGIRTPDADRPVRQLSGGNQQKVILARWLAMRPRVLILDEPTRGVDVGARGEIERLVSGLARGGMAVVFVSAELDEVARRSDRVLVLRDRRVVGEVAGDRVGEAALMEAIAGKEGEGV